MNELFDYNLPSTVKNLDPHFSNLKQSKKIKFLVVGAGPIGLYASLYLNYLYGDNVEILLIDNRIAREGVKLPYSRTTQFGYDISQMRVVFDSINCWKNLNMSGGCNRANGCYRAFDFIYILENLLFLQAFDKNIPMYFTSRKHTEMTKYFDVIFDCTGGRIEPIKKYRPWKIKVPQQWENYSIKYFKDNNRYNLKIKRISKHFANTEIKDATN